MKTKILTFRDEEEKTILDIEIHTDGELSIYIQDAEYSTSTLFAFNPQTDDIQKVDKIIMLLNEWSRRAKNIYLE